MRYWLLALALTACNRGHDVNIPTWSADTPLTTEGPTGFIGSPCAADTDCDYAGGRCLLASEGFPGGSCTADCAQFCPDADGFPTTFCTDAGALPTGVTTADGACLQRCDFGAYPFSGCRQDYGCVEAARANEPASMTYVCLPGTSDLSPCLADLADRGVPFSPTVIADQAPSEAPSLTCHVEEPIVLQSGYRGIDLAFHEDEGGGTVRGSCVFGHALADTLEGVADLGVVTLRHLGAYTCRTIAGTGTLSRHAYGDALDISAFDFRDGSRLSLLDDWEHETTEFTTDGAEWLYDVAYGWHQDEVWTVILTPNYNLAHNNHFHVDLTPGSDFIGVAGPHYFGPAPYDD